VRRQCHSDDEGTAQCACGRFGRPQPTARQVGQQLAPTLAPTRVLIKIRKALTWSGWRDSNPRPPAPKAGALTKLRHIPSL
jgi:hypothetical protein